jgi:hypothetical protein
MTMIGAVATGVGRTGVEVGVEVEGTAPVLGRESLVGEARGAKSPGGGVRTLTVADAGGRRRPPLGACLLVYLPSRRGAVVAAVVVAVAVAVWG